MLINQFFNVVIINLFGSFFAQLIIFLSNLVISNFLGQKIFGEYSLVQNTISTFSNVGQLSLGFATNKFVSEYWVADLNKAMSLYKICKAISIASAIIVSMIVVCMHDVLFNEFLNQGLLNSYVYVISISIFASIYNSFQFGAIGGVRRYDLINKLTIMSGIAAGFVFLFSAYFHSMSLLSLGIILLPVSKIILSEISLYGLGFMSFTNSNIAVNKSTLKADLLNIVNFCLPATLSGITTMPSVWLVNLYLSSNENGISEFSLYIAALNIKSAMMILPQLVNNVCMSFINSKRGENDLLGYKLIFWQNLVSSIFSIRIIALTVNYFGMEILKMFGKEFGRAHHLLQLMCISSIIEVLILSMYQIIQAEGNLWQSFKFLSLPRDLSFLIISYVLIPSLGANGVAVACVFSQVIGLIGIFILIIKEHINDKLRAGLDEVL
jgi:O-antigen/teichoic acid export membrane protein